MFKIKQWIFFLIIALSFSLTGAQVLDTIVSLPEPPEFLFCIPDINKLYITGRSGDVYVLNCSTMVITSVLRFTALDGRVSSYPVWSSRQHRLYYPICFERQMATALAIVDVDRDSLLNVVNMDIWTDEYMYPLAYNSVLDKIYAAGTYAITVFDAVSDSILKVFRPSNYTPGGFAVWDSLGNRIYIGSWGWRGPFPITVINCPTDSVIALIPGIMGWPQIALLHSLRRKMYVGCFDYWITVIDCNFNQVVKRWDTIWVDHYTKPVLAASEDKIYWPVPGYPNDTLLIINTKEDTIIRRITISSILDASVFVEWSNRLYIAHHTSSGHLYVTVFDCATDSVVGSCKYLSGSFVSDMSCNRADRRIYLARYWDSCIYVFQDSLVGVEERAEVSLPAEAEPTLVRSILYLPERAGVAGKPVLVDITGRRVLELVPGANDVRCLTPGVYFIRSNAGVERKLVIAR